METAEFYLSLNDAEIKALKEHLKRVGDRDRNKRIRAVREYRQWLDYLESMDRITPELRQRLEHFKLEERHR